MKIKEVLKVLFVDGNIEEREEREEKRMNGKGMKWGVGRHPYQIKERNK